MQPPRQPRFNFGRIRELRDAQLQRWQARQKRRAELRVAGAAAEESRRFRPRLEWVIIACIALAFAGVMLVRELLPGRSGPDVAVNGTATAVAMQGGDPGIIASATSAAYPTLATTALVGGPNDLTAIAQLDRTPTATLVQTPGIDDPYPVGTSPAPPVESDGPLPNITAEGQTTEVALAPTFLPNTPTDCNALPGIPCPPAGTGVALPTGFPTFAPPSDFPTSAPPSDFPTSAPPSDFPTSSGGRPTPAGLPTAPVTDPSQSPYPVPTTRGNDPLPNGEPPVVPPPLPTDPPPPTLTPFRIPTSTSVPLPPAGFTPAPVRATATPRPSSTLRPTPANGAGGYPVSTNVPPVRATPTTDGGGGNAPSIPTAPSAPTPVGVPTAPAVPTVRTAPTTRTIPSPPTSPPAGEGEPPVPDASPVPTNAPVPGASPVPTNAPVPTDTPAPALPTETPEPTATTGPTATPAPTPTETPLPFTVVTGETRWNPRNGPVILTKDTVLAVGANLLIDPGTEVQLRPGVTFFVEGNLSAQGAPGAPVRFIGPAGRWDGLRGRPGSSITLVNSEIRQSGQSGVAVSSNGGVLIIRDSAIADGGGSVITNGATVDIRTTRISGNNLQAGPAINVTLGGRPVTLLGNVIGGNQTQRGTPEVKIIAGSDGGGPLDIRNNLFYGSGAAALELNTAAALGGTLRCNALVGGTLGLSITGSVASGRGFALAIDQNAFAGQSSYGMSSAVGMDAPNNWWGDASGPTEPTKNNGGQGVPVGVNINFAPWLAERPGCAPQP